MTISELYNEIDKAYLNKRYPDLFKMLNQYFNNKYSMIDDKLISTYIEALIGLNHYEEALKLSKLYDKIYSDVQSKRTLAKINIIKGEYKEAENIIRNSIEESNHAKDYYYLGKSLFYQGRLSESKEAFQAFLDKFHNNYEFQRLKALSYISRIEGHEQTGYFLETGYESFKKQYGQITPQYLVYLKETTKPLPVGVPFLIWKIENDTVYGFPVRTNINPNFYIIHQQDYHNIKKDRIVTRPLIAFQKTDIKTVLEYLSDKDFMIIKKNIYRQFYFDNSPKNSLEKNFMQEELKEFAIKENDVLIYFNKEEKKKHFYFIIDNSNEESYLTIELEKDENNNLKVLSEQPLSIRKKENYPMNVIKLRNDELKNILSSLKEQQVRIRK